MLLIGTAFASTANLREDTFPVHEKVSVVVEIELDEVLAPGDQLILREPILHGMRWAKWGYIQTDPTACTVLSEDGDSASVGLVRASTDGDAVLELRHTVDGPGIHELGEVEVELVGGALGPGDLVVVEMGVEEGNCGWQTADRAFSNLELVVGAVIAGTEVDIDTLSIDFSPEDELAYTEVFVPSQALVDEAVVARVVSLDRWGNALSVDYSEVAFESPGVFRVASGSSLSNPIRVTDDPIDDMVWWGDLHTHHGNSWEEAGNWVDANHDYARDVLGYDFGCESVKGYPHELEYEDLWERQKRTCQAYTDADYVALLGFEWMGGATEGHHNVYYSTCDGPLGPMDMETVAEGLWPFVEDVIAETGQDVLTIPHAPSFTGYNWGVADERLRPVAEVYSEWGNSMEPLRNGSVPQGLSLGQRLGFIASSDNHDGWLGNGLAEKNSPGGIAAVVSQDLSAPALLQALHDRSSYATTGARILLDVEASEDGQVHPMGSAFASREARFSWEAHGTAEISSVRLVASRVGAQELAFEISQWTPMSADSKGEAIVPWGPDELAVWVEVLQVDGEMAWSSPIWLERQAPPPSTGGCGGSAALLLLVLFLRKR
ncbi:MAG TPA: DUF3604 domain-containing protein [Myxococcota bacterium]|nr:DUF3604 domain-containing protein [Myxococcota bacterium]